MLHDQLLLSRHPSREESTHNNRPDYAEHTEPNRHPRNASRHRLGIIRTSGLWPIETAIAGGKQLLGIGQARNRLQRAVERTVPLSFCVYSLVVIWYTLHGYHPDDLTSRRADQPWYPHKDDIAFEDMLAKLRRTLVAARITGVDAAQPDPRKYRDYELACAAAAA